MDIVATPPTGPKLHVDVTICNPAARPHANKTEKALFDAQRKEKEKRHAEVAKTNGCELITLLPHGLRSKALAYGNGARLLLSNQLLTLYGVSLKGTPRAIRAPVGFRALGDGDDVGAVGAEDSGDGESDAKAIVATVVTARDDAWSDAGDADGDAGSDDEDARSMMSFEDVDEGRRLRAVGSVVRRPADPPGVASSIPGKGVFLQKPGGHPSSVS